jgi:hypothetical protein
VGWQAPVVSQLSGNTSGGIWEKHTGLKGDGMLRTRLCGVALIAASVGLTAPVVETTGSGSRADVVYEWNQILQDTITATGPAAPRYFAIMHVVRGVNDFCRSH